LLSSRTELEIAIIGAAEFELGFGLAFFEEIVHCLPSLRRLTLRFIGPNAGNREVQWIPCAHCNEKGVQLQHSIHPCTFHDYVNERTTAEDDDEPPFQWPDLAVLFNSGMGSSDLAGERGWRPTLEKLAKSGIPTLLTAFLRREAKEDEDLLYKMQCNIVIKRHKNPWRSDFVTKMVYTRKGYFFYNGFVQGFRGSRERGGQF